MKTTITLTKKRGLFRPLATITVELDPWEKDLIHYNIDLSFCVEGVISFHQSNEVSSSITTDEQDGPEYSDRAYIRWDKGSGKWIWEKFLPWKRGALTIEDYPLEQLAHCIQDKITKILTLAMESAEIQQVKELPPHSEYKRKAAAIKFATVAKEEG
jgi:hypothetical protein